MTAAAPFASRSAHLPWRSAAVLWVLFFLVCGGLGFHGIRRYDPRATRALSDARQYVALVTGTARPAPREQEKASAPSPAGVSRRSHRSYRILVPYLARPVYALIRDRVRGVHPALLALLVVNAALMAAAATVLAMLAPRLGLQDGVGMLGGCLLLLNIWVPNFYLVGLVDAGEMCAALLLAWALLHGRWWMLPPVCVAGALAKETFVVFAAVMAAVWWWMEWRRSAHAWRAAVWIAGSLAAALGAVLLVRAMLSGDAAGPMAVVGSLARPGPGLLRRFAWLLADPDFWAGLVWLAPLGLWSIRRLPRAWVAATFAAAGAAFLMGAYAMAGGANVARPVFTLIGPPLSLAAALTLVRQPWLRGNEVRSAEC
jgi:hypothetical protein